MTTNLLPALINASFLIFLLITTIWMAKPYFANNITSKDIERQKIIDRVGVVVISTSVGIIIVIISVVMSTEFNIIEGDDISNWVTLIVEIGIGIVIAMSILIYSRHHDNKIDIENKEEKTKRQNHARKEIYRILKGVDETVRKREYVRTRKQEKNPNVDLKKEILFMNKQIVKVVEALQFVLLLHNENLPLSFMEKTRYRLEGLEVSMNRLEMDPLEKYDPKNEYTKDFDEFIEYLKKIESDIK